MSRFSLDRLKGAHKAPPSGEGSGSRGSNNPTPSLPTFKFRKSEDNLEILDGDEFISTASTKFELRSGKSDERAVGGSRSSAGRPSSPSQGLSQSYSGAERPTSFTSQLSSSYTDSDRLLTSSGSVLVVNLDGSQGDVSDHSGYHAGDHHQIKDLHSNVDHSASLQESHYDCSISGESVIVDRSISGESVIVDRSISGERFFREDRSNSLVETTIVSTTASSPEVYHDIDPRTAPSPMKERLLCAFARLAPDHSSRPAPASSISSSLASTSSSVAYSEPVSDGSRPSFRIGQQSSETKTEGSSSWLLQVKGRFSKSSAPSVPSPSLPGLGSPATPGSSSSHQPASSCAKDNPAVLDIVTPTNVVDITADSLLQPGREGISHSVSDFNLGNPQQGETETGKKRPQSQIFDFESTDWSVENEGGEIEKSGNEVEDNISTAPSVDTPSKVRKRFGISFLDRSGSPSKPSTPVKPAGDTPRRSLRSIMMKSFKTAPADATVTQSECGVADLMIEGGYPEGADSNLGPPSLPSQHVKQIHGDVDEDGVEAQEEEYTWNSDYDINQYGYMKGEARDESTVNGQANCRVHKVPVLVNPVIVVILAVINFTGLFPGWLSGFLTGLILCGILSITLLLYLNPAVSYSPTRQETTKPTQIQVFEEPPLTQAWMNLLPQKYHPYDCETYQVKNTISVRVTIEHHMLKIEYPEKNISMRQTADEIIPPDLKFHLHTDHIDLSTASIRLLPDKLANSKKFKKKYPIEIRPNGLKPGNDAIIPPNCCPEFDGEDADLEEYESLDGSPLSASPPTRLGVGAGAGLEPSSPIQANLDATAGKELTSDRQNTSNSLVSEQQETKSFYLFARSDREKEDIYKALLDGHHFLQDSFRDADSIQGIYTPPNGRMTARERTQFFADFMAKVMDAPTAKYPTNPETSHFTGGLDVQYPEWCAHFLNVYIYRIFYDVHQNKDLTEMIMKKVNNKLAKVKELKYFKYIGITGLNFGRTTPQIKWVSRPTQNVRGLWTHIGLEYEGCITVSIEISGLNLLEDAPGGGVQFKMNVEEDTSAEAVTLPVKPQNPGIREWSRLEAATNSDEEDSDESDSEEQDIVGVDGEHGQPSRKWWEIVQENDLIKSGLSRLSATCWWKSKVENIDFTLRLEVRKIKGVLVLNVPPPDTDRVWFAFKTSPELDIRMLSYFGTDLLGDDSSFKSTIINKVFQLINTKIEEEVVKLVVLPNMIDLPIKVMDGLPYSNIPQQNTQPDPRNNVDLVL